MLHWNYIKVINDTLLISCPGIDGGLFMVNGESCVRLSDRPITGMSSNNRRLVFAYQSDDGKSIRIIMDGRTKEVELGESRLDLHDVLCEQDRTYVVATELNSVVQLDKNYIQADSWRLPGENDSLHLNSVIFYDGRLLASIFGRFKRHREYKAGTVGRGEVIDIRSGETYISGLSQPHSLTALGDLLYLCNSEQRQVRVYRGNELIQQIDMPGYTRGLTISEGNIYVGTSLTRNEEHLTSGVDTATIEVLDSKTMQKKNDISLPCREIYSILNVTSLEGLFPHLLADLLDEKVLADDLSAQYKRGYESYLRENESLMHQIGERKANEKQLSQKFDDSRADNKLLTLELEKALAQVEEMRQSMSWRLTMPFRRIYNKFKR